MELFFWFLLPLVATGLAVISIADWLLARSERKANDN